MSALKLLAAAAGFGYIVLFVSVAILRARHPFELEWMEGATLEHVRRVMNGAPLYVAPTLDFVPFAYPPLYYYVCATAGLITGADFGALRIVSILAALGCLGLIGAIVRREAGTWAGIIAASLFAATYSLSGAWLDLGRVDTLYLFFATGAWFFLTRHQTRAAAAGAAVCVVLAFATKQPIVLSVAPVAAYLAIAKPRAFLWFGVPAGAGLVLIVLVADALTQGYYSYYVLKLPRLRMAVSLDPARSWLFWGTDLLRHLWPALLGICMGVWHMYRSSTRSGRTAHGEAREGAGLRHALLAAGFVLSSWLARLEGGAWTNALLPAYAAIAILFGLSAPYLRAAWLVPGLALLQFALLAYDPWPLVPSQRHAEAGRAVVAAIAAVPGDVLVLDHGYLGAMAGKRTFAHGWALTDVLWADYRGAGIALESAVRERLARRELAAVVLDDTPHWFSPVIDAHYPAATILPGVDSLWPPSGAPRRPFVIRTR